MKDKTKQNKTNATTKTKQAKKKKKEGKKRRKIGRNLKTFKSSSFSTTGYIGILKGFVKRDLPLIPFSCPWGMTLIGRYSYANLLQMSHSNFQLNGSRCLFFFMTNTSPPCSVYSYRWMDVRSPFPPFSVPAFKAYFLHVTTRSNFFFHFPEPQIIFFPETGVN